MSHSRVRSEIKQALTAWGQAQAQPVAFIDTINRNDKPPAGNWTTAQFFAAAVQPV